MGVALDEPAAAPSDAPSTLDADELLEAWQKQYGHPLLSGRQMTTVSVLQRQGCAAPQFEGMVVASVVARAVEAAAVEARAVEGATVVAGAVEGAAVDARAVVARTVVARTVVDGATVVGTAWQPQTRQPQESVR